MANKPLTQILYAEDEADIRVIAKIALEDIGGFQVKYCSNGKELIDTAKNYKPDLILIDVMMPIMDGPAALLEIRKLPGYEFIPAIFMTAKVQSNEINAYKSLGAIDVISKPFDPMSLADTIKGIWNKIEETA